MYSNMKLFHYICEIISHSIKMKVTFVLTNEQAKIIAEDYNAKNKTNLTYPLTYSIVQAAREIGISESTIRRHIKDELIKTKIIGKRPRITQEEIDRYKNIGTDNKS